MCPTGSINQDANRFVMLAVYVVHFECNGTGELCRGEKKKKRNLSLLQSPVQRCSIAISPRCSLRETVPFKYERTYFHHNIEHSISQIILNDLV